MYLRRTVVAVKCGIFELPKSGNSIVGSGVLSPAPPFYRW